MITALLVAGCAADPTGPAASPGPETPRTTAAPTLAVVATPKVTPTPIPTITPSPPAWTEVPAQAALTGVEFSDVIWTGTRFVAVGSVGGRGVFLDSGDGVTWHRQPGRGSLGGPTLLATGSGGVVAVGLVGTRPASWSSPDGLVWTLHEDAFHADGGPAQGDVTDVVARGNGWLAVGLHVPDCSSACAPDRAVVWTSSDGSVWTAEKDQATFHDGWMNAVTRIEGGFVAVGEASSAAVWTSADGHVWNRVPDISVSKGPGGSEYGTAATGVARRGDITVMVGWTALADDTMEGIAWWSSGGPLNEAFGPGAQDGEPRVVATPDGFLATGWSTDCLGAIWRATDGDVWQCDATDPGFAGFEPVAAAASDTAEVVVGSLTTVWVRPVQ